MSPSPGVSAVRGGWRRFIPRPRQMLWGVLLAFVTLVGLLAVAYALTSIPSPNSFATQQTTYLYYSDGRHPLARLGSVNRTDVPLSQVPQDVQNAVLSAEDRNFWSEPGISPTGILRALWTDLRGGDIQQGGSTITQQYVKNAYLSQQRTFSRKIKEILIAVKLGQTRSKSEILHDYLNTIYFGRGANGIEAAARAYFHKHVWQLNAAEGAVLAAAIQAPSYFDPTIHHAASVARWHYVVDGMAKRNWLTADQAARIRYPAVKPPTGSASSLCVADIGFICQAARQSLQKLGFDDQRLAVGGYKVVTTIDYKAQHAAETAMQDNKGYYQTHGVDAGREASMVSVQPGDGAIRAMYGGSDYCEHLHHHDCIDLTGVSSDFRRSPGSSFKPYTLIAALRQGISLDSTYPGPKHIDFPGTNGQGISNSDNESCGSCTLTQALAESINTIFVPLARDVGPDNIATVAYEAGIPRQPPLTAVPTLTLGTSDVSVLDQAVGYATIAAQGVRAEPYLIQSIRSDTGDTVYKSKPQTERVFSPDVMADTTYAMQQVLDNPKGTAHGHGLQGRPAAGKTGTNGQKSGNFDAWFIGFTPQLSTAVWYGNWDHTEVTVNGAPMYGGSVPAATWQEMMDITLAGLPVQSFPPPAHVGNVVNSAPPSPTETPSSTPTSTQPSGPPIPTSRPPGPPGPPGPPLPTSSASSSSPSPTGSTTTQPAPPGQGPP